MSGRLVLLFVALLIGGARAQSEPLEGRVSFLELFLSYGDLRTEVAPGEGEVHRVDDRLTFRSSHHVLRYGVDERIRLGNHEFEARLESRNDRLAIAFALDSLGRHRAVVRRRRFFIRQTETLTAASHLHSLTPHVGQIQRSSGGRMTRVYGIFQVDGDEEPWGPTFGASEPIAFLRYAVDRFREPRYRNRSTAVFLADLARFLPLGDAIFDRTEMTELLASAEEMIADGPGVQTNGWFQVSYDPWLVEQAALAHGLEEWIPQDWRVWFRRGPRTWAPSCHSTYRYLAGRSDVPGPARAVAMARAVGRYNRISQHDEMMDAISSGEIRLDEPERGEILRWLRAEVGGRRPTSLAGLCAGAMGALLVSMLVLRLVARRVMFA